MVHPSGIVVIFDLDGTILDGDSEMLWSRYLLERGLVDADFDRKTTAFFRDYQEGRLNFKAYEEHLLTSLSIASPEVLLKERGRYLGRIQAALRPQMLERIQWHRRQSHKTLLLTATNHFLAGPIAEQLEFTTLICTQAEMDGQWFTGRLAGIPAFREGKITRLNAWLEENHLALDNSWAYSDSQNDLPLLTRVEHPVAVMPDVRLRQHAMAHGWEIFDFS